MYSSNRIFVFMHRQKSWENSGIMKDQLENNWENSGIPKDQFENSWKNSDIMKDQLENSWENSGIMKDELNNIVKYPIMNPLSQEFEKESYGPFNNNFNRF